MLATRQSLRLLARLPSRRAPLLTPRPQFQTFTRTFATTLPRAQKPDTEGDEAAREEYIRAVREKWGGNLPENLLTDIEFALYERNYGKPVRMLKEGESPFEEDEFETEELEELEEGTLTLQGQDGEVLEIFEPKQGRELEEEEFSEEEEFGEGVEGSEELDYIPVDIKNEADAKSYLQLQKDMERAFSHRHGKEEHELDQGYDEGDEFADVQDDNARIERTHPLTSIGRFATFPVTIRVPPSVQQPTMDSLADVPNKHLDQAATRIFGSKQLADSPVFTNSGGKNLKAVLLNVEDARMSDIESETWLATVLPGYYSQSLSALTELRRRLGSDWVLGGGKERGVKKILDVGSGGAAVLAWKSIIEAEQARRRGEAIERIGAEESTLPPPEPDFGELKATVVTASDPLRYRMAKHLSNTTFLPRIPDRNPDNIFNSPSYPTTTLEPNQKQVRKTYDLIIATHNMLPLKENHHKRDRIKKLWSNLNPKGGILLIIEKGTPLGFEAVAGARSTILRNYISSPNSSHRPVGGNTGLDVDNEPIEKEAGAIIAPCTNHEKCPLFPHGYTNCVGRKDWCHFVQRYERPSYLQRIMGESGRNHDDILYSYVAFRRGIDYRHETEVISPEVEEFKQPVGWGHPTQSPYTMDQLRRYAFTLPRTLFPPIKRHGHVTFDLCTPAGTLERWTVPKSYSRVAYRDARKSRWGDLWALGGKSKTMRNIRVGGSAPPGKFAQLVRVMDKEGNLEEKVAFRQGNFGSKNHWSRGNAKLGEKVKKRQSVRSEQRWRAREKEMGVDGF